MNNPKIMLNFLDDSFIILSNLAKEIKYDKDNAQQLTLITTYMSILEYTESCIILIDRNKLIGVPSLFRSMLEAHADLLNLTNNALYGYRLRSTYLHETIKLIKWAQDDPQAKLLLTEIFSDRQSMIDEYTQLEKAGYTKLRIYDKFELAGMLDTYKCMYSILCNSSHNNLLSLAERHICGSQDDFLVVAFRKYTLEDSIKYVDAIIACLLSTTELIHKFFKSDQLATISKQMDKLNNLKSFEKVIA